MIFLIFSWYFLDILISWYFLTNATCHQGTACPWTVPFPIQLISISGMVPFLTSTHFTREGTSEYGQPFPVLLGSFSTQRKKSQNPNPSFFQKPEILWLKKVWSQLLTGQQYYSTPPCEQLGNHQLQQAENIKAPLAKQKSFRAKPKLNTLHNLGSGCLKDDPKLQNKEHHQQ